MSKNDPDLLMIFELLEGVDDPRRDHGKKFSVMEILVVTLCGSLCGYNSFVEIAEWAEEHVEQLRKIVPLAAGTPSHDTLSRLFRILDPNELAEVLRAWLEEVTRGLGEASHIAIDGKALRGSFERATSQSILHLVSAWRSDIGLSLCQVKVADKANELVALPEVLKKLSLKKSVVTIDAMGCQTAVAEQITKQGGDYVLALKDNHPTDFEEVSRHFRIAERTALLGHDTHADTDKGHGRIEQRRCDVLPVGAWMKNAGKWAGLKSVVRVTSTRTTRDKTTTEERFFLSSLPSGAARIAAVVRGHWGIENKLHWVLDVEFGEDHSRVRKDRGPENLAIFRKLTLNLIRVFEPHPEKPRKVSLKGKRRRCAWNFELLLSALTGKRVVR